MHAHRARLWRVLRSPTIFAMLLAAGMLTGLPRTHGAEPGDLSFATASNLPPMVRDVLFAHKDGLAPFVLSDHINPYYLHGDFDGDHSLDTAIWIKDRATRKAGLLIVRGADRRVYVIGAGRILDEGFDDVRSFDGWYIFLRGKVGRGFEGPEPPELLGDAIRLEKSESGGGLVYWTGEAFAWYGQGC